jgi:hypothetical protein
MARPRTLALDRHGRVGVEYVRSRRVLRMVGDGTDRVEISVPAFLEGLGIETGDLGGPTTYLLFASSDPQPQGGMADVAGVFGVDAEAREAFRAIRLSPSYRHGWAELVAVGPGPRAHRLCWFGHPWARPTSAGPRPGATRLRSWPRLRRRR